WAAAPPDTGAGTASVPLDQRQGPAPIRAGLRPVDAISGGGPDRAKVRHQIGPYGGRWTARQAPPDTTEAAATGISARSGGDRAVAARDLSNHCTASQGGRWRGLLLGVSRRCRSRADLGCQGTHAGRGPSWVSGNQSVPPLR